MRTKFFAIDRIEGNTAVVQSEDGKDHAVPIGALPPTSQEGSVLRVDLDDQDDPDWNTARVDEQETHRRIAEARARIEELRNRD
jgi:hypothetical protein